MIIFLILILLLIYISFYRHHERYHPFSQNLYQKQFYIPIQFKYDDYRKVNTDKYKYKSYKNDYLLNPNKIMSYNTLSYDYNLKIKPKEKKFKNRNTSWKYRSDIARPWYYQNINLKDGNIELLF